LVEIGPEGRRAVTPIPIAPTPLIVATVSDAAGVAEQIAAQVSDPSAAVVRVVGEPAAADAGSAVDLAIRDALPNVSIIDRRPPPEDALPLPIPEGGSVRERVLNYLDGRLAADDPQRDGVLALATEFLDHEGHR